jgi:DNA-binding IclR family transcriptional regulator
VGEKYIVEALDRGLKVLDVFADSGDRELRLTEISERLGLSKSLTLRMTSTLEARGYLARDPETKRYRLGVRAFRLGLAAERNFDLKRVAAPILRDLARDTRETISLIAVDAAGPICIEVIESPQRVRVFAQVGRRMPWHAGTSGKVILAYLSPEEQVEILSGTFEKYSATTVTDPAELRSVLEQIRRDGYYVGTTDLDEHARGVAAPIFDHTGELQGAVSVSAPVSRMSLDEETASLRDRVRAAAAAISISLGWNDQTVHGLDLATPAAPAAGARTKTFAGHL